MPIEEDIKTRLQQLLNDSADLSRGDKNGQCTDQMGVALILIRHAAR